MRMPLMAKKTSTPRLAMVVEPGGAEGAQGMERVVAEHDGEDGDGAPAVERGQIAGGAGRCGWRDFGWRAGGGWWPSACVRSFSVVRESSLRATAADFS